MTSKTVPVIPDWVILSALPLFLLAALKTIHPADFHLAGQTFLSFGMMLWAPVAILLLDMVGAKRLPLVILSALGCASVALLPYVLGATPL